MELLIERADFSLLRDQQNDWLFVRWRGAQTQESILLSCAILLEQVRETGCDKILNDSTLDEDGWGRLVKWLSDKYFNQLSASGVGAVAWVLPTNLRALVDVRRVVKAVRRPLVDVFHDTEAACAWLSRLPKQ